MTGPVEHEPPSAPAPPAEATGFGAKFVRAYASADPRSLGLLRIALGGVLFMDVALRFPEVEAHLSNTGWLSNHFALFRPMADHLFSVYFAFSSPLEVKLLLSAHLLVCVLLLAGYRTKLMQLLALLLSTSLNSRNVLIENAGSIALNVVLVWTAFLPLGVRFSVDSMRTSLRAHQETTAAALNDRADPTRRTRPVVSGAVTALLLQWAAIYGFNALQKYGVPWRDGTAAYYLLQQDGLVTWLGERLRGLMPLGGFKLLTFAILALEGALPFLLLSPWRPHAARAIAIAIVVVLHLSLGSLLQLGAYSWAMLVVSCAFVPPSAWEWLKRYFSARRAACVLHFDPESGAALALCRLVKRLDALHLVTFRPLDDASPKKARKSLCVSVDVRKSVVGWDALLAIADALWFGRRPLALLAPLLRRRVSRRLAQMATEPAELDLDFGLQHLPAQGDARAAEPSPAHQLRARILGHLREGGVLLMLLVCTTQLLIDNPIVSSRFKPRARPPVLEAVVEYPRIFQEWSLFAPAPPSSESRLVIDGRTKDGRKLDPLTGDPPVFEVPPASAPRANVIWATFHARIAQDRFRAYWNGVRDFVMAHHKVMDRPEDELVSFDAYYVTETFPPPGGKKVPPERRKLFSSSWMPGEPEPLLPARPQSKPPKHRAQ